LKGIHHKYISKSPDGKGGWNYTYGEPKKVIGKKKEENNDFKKVKEYANKVINGVLWNPDEELYLYYGNSGVIHTSTNGAYWEPMANVTTSNITSMTYGKNKYVYGTTNSSLYTSTNLMTWVAVASGAVNAAASIVQSQVFGNDTFLYSVIDRVFVSDDPDQLFANGYNTAIEFYVPDLTVGNTINVTTDSVYSIVPITTRYLKAK
jgi:hypothetical protein